MRSRRKKISTLGTLAILAGSLAWFAMQTGRSDKGAVLIGAGGTVLAMLAMLGAMLIGNTGKILPLLGFLTSASITGYGMSHQATRAAAVDQVKQWVARITPAPPAAPKPAPATPVTPATPAPPTADVKPVGSGTIFDMTSGGKGSAASPNSPSAPLGPSVITPPSILIPQPVTPPAPTLNATQRYSAASAAVAKAHAKVDAATAGLLPALSQTPAYQTAKTELDAADAALKAARANGGPGNAELVAAGQRYLDAKTAVQKLINDVADTDPTTVAAKQELITAQGDLRAAKEEMSNTKGTGKK